MLKYKRFHDGSEKGDVAGSSPELGRNHNVKTANRSFENVAQF
jgi:hypothetical protein